MADVSIPKNLNAIDLAKFMAAVLIVYIHTEPLNTIAPVANFLIMNVVARCAVPFFFMASGYIFYGKFLVNQTRPKMLSNYGWKYLQRVLILYATWSLVYLPYMVYQILSLHTSGTKLIFYCSRNILYLGTSFHMWYFPALIFSIAILDIWKSRFQLKWLLIVAALVYAIGLLGESYYGLVPTESAMYQAFNMYFHFFLTTRNGLFFGLLFVSLGAYIYEKPLKLTVRQSALLTVISLCFLCVEVLLLKKYTQPRDYNFMIASVPLGVFLFQMLIKMNLSWELNYHALRKLSVLIYCLHVVFVILFSASLRYWKFETLDHNNFILFPLVLVSSLFFSILILKLEKNKYIGFIVRKLV